MKNIKLDLNSPIINLDGAMFPDISGEGVMTCAKIAAGHLAQSREGDAVKYVDWARSLYKVGVIEVDKSDLKKIKEMFKDSNQFPAITKAAILECIEKSEELHNKEAKSE